EGAARLTAQLACLLGRNAHGDARPVYAGDELAGSVEGGEAPGRVSALPSSMSASTTRSSSRNPGLGPSGPDRVDPRWLGFAFDHPLVIADDHRSFGGFSCRRRRSAW